MGILDNPPTRPRTYVEGTEVDPNDMNDIFDALIALRDSKARPLTWFNGTSYTLGSFDGAGAEFAAGYIVSTNAADTAVVVIDNINPGEKITGFKFWTYGNGAADLTVELWKVGALDAARALVATVNIDDSPAAWTLMTWALGVDELEVAEGDVLTLIITASAAGVRMRATSHVFVTPL